MSEAASVPLQQKATFDGVGISVLQTLTPLTTEGTVGREQIAVQGLAIAKILWLPGAFDKRTVSEAGHSLWRQ